ncbi:hypothetical protein GCM10009817_26830 [Terrabacter lapilli]|uniref:PknH-like protein n=1 Tax=Terrabacter lapilli TaxID=436231 RepID=A0ABP5DPB2_9MICO
MGNGGDGPPGRRTTLRLGGILRASAGARRAASAGTAARAGLAVAAVTLSACTAAMPPGVDRTPLLASPAPVLTTIDGMTAAPEAVECVNERLDSRRSALPGPQLFPQAFPGTVSVRVIRPGRDASDPACGATLPERFSCRDATTWADPDPTEFLLTFGARQVKVVEGASAARTQSSEGGPGLGPSKRSFTYAEYALPEGDPRGAVAFERRVFDICAPAGARVVSGLEGHTATIGTQTGPADVAFLAVGGRLAQVALSGSRWAAGERDHAWEVVAQHLLQER